MFDKDKKETIKLDKVDFDLMVKTMTDLKNRVEELEKPAIAEVTEKMDIITQISVAYANEDKELIMGSVKNFEAELLGLMKKYKIPKVTAEILKRL